MKLRVNSRITFRSDDGMILRGVVVHIDNRNQVKILWEGDEKPYSGYTEEEVFRRYEVYDEVLRIEETLKRYGD